MQEVRVAVVGLAGYAASHLETARMLEGAGIRLAAVVARDPSENPAEMNRLQAGGVRIYSRLEELLDAGGVDLITLPTSIASHARLAIQAMEAGFHVLCEKPPAAAIEDVDAMRAAAERSGKVCAIGFQDLYSKPMQQLKKRLAAGEFGALREAASRGAWPRSTAYYRRNPWAGRLAHDGSYALDGPLTNALSHFLQSALYLLGAGPDETAAPMWVQGELYRARPDIEGHDTFSLRLSTERGQMVHFYGTHSSRAALEPFVEVVADRARIRWDRSGAVTIVHADGRREIASESAGNPTAAMFLNVAEAVRTGLGRPLCDLENSRPFVLAMNSAHESSGRIHAIAEDHVERHGSEDREILAIRGVEEIVDGAFASRRLFSEMEVPWSVKTEPFDCAGYTAFGRRFNAGAPLA